MEPICLLICFSSVSPRVWFQCIWGGENKEEIKSKKVRRSFFKNRTFDVFALNWNLTPFAVSPQILLTTVRSLHYKLINTEGSSSLIRRCVGTRRRPTYSQNNQRSGAEVTNSSCKPNKFPVECNASIVGLNIQILACVCSCLCAGYYACLGESYSACCHVLS